MIKKSHDKLIRKFKSIDKKFFFFFIFFIIALFIIVLTVISSQQAKEIRSNAANRNEFPPQLLNREKRPTPTPGNIYDQDIIVRNMVSTFFNASIRYKYVNNYWPWVTDVYVLSLKTDKG